MVQQLVRMHVLARQQVFLGRLVKLEIMAGCVCDGAVIEERRAVSPHMLGTGTDMKIAAQFAGVVARNWSANRPGTWIAAGGQLA